MSCEVGSTSGPDRIPNIVLKTFAFELACFVIAGIYNTILREGYRPSLLKSNAVMLIPEKCPFNDIEKNIRPIALRCQLAVCGEIHGTSRSLYLPSSS